MLLVLSVALTLAADSASSVQVVLPDRLTRAAEAETPGVPLDSLVRIPGSTLRLGWDLHRAAVLGSFVLSASASSQETRDGDLRWFGYPARASLTFRSGRLAAVRFTAGSASPRFSDFVPDELRRAGYRRVASEGTPPGSITRWEGPLSIQLTRSGSSVVAEVKPREPEAPPATEPSSAEAGTTAAAPPSAAAPARTPAAASPDSAPLVDFTAPGAESLAAPVPLPATFAPVRPAIAVDAGVFGRVMVRVTVAADGTVEHAAIERGIAELNTAALAWAGAQRFTPLVRDGRPARFVTILPVAFLPSSASGSSR